MAFLTNHAQVLVCVSRDPDMRLREIGSTIGITERAAHRILGELEEGGYVTRQRKGRRINYTVHSDRPMGDAVVEERMVGELISFVAATNGRNGATRNGSGS